MKTLEQRINNVIGQLGAINRMLEQGDDCFAILTQMKAAKSGLSGAMSLYMEEKAQECSNDPKQLQRIIQELTK